MTKTYDINTNYEDLRSDLLDDNELELLDSNKKVVCKVVYIESIQALADTLLVNHTPNIFICNDDLLEEKNIKYYFYDCSIGQRYIKVDENISDNFEKIKKLVLDYGNTNVVKEATEFLRRQKSINQLKFTFYAF